MNNTIWTGDTSHTDVEEKPNENKNNPIKKEDIEKIIRNHPENNMQNKFDVYSRDTDIFFYTTINNTTAIQFQTELNKIYKSILENVNAAQVRGYQLVFPPIKIHFNSPGGGIFAAFMMIDTLRLLKQRDPRVVIHTIIEGISASAATLISVTGDKRFCTKYGYMLIHQLSGSTGGKYNEIKDNMENINELMDRIKQIYQDHTTIPKEDFDSILSHDRYWNAKKCLKMGLIDEIL